MSDPFSSALSRLVSGAEELCEHRVGMASAFDDDASRCLSQQYGEAVRVLTDAFGEPAQGAFCFPDRDIERAACWNRSGKVLYVSVSLEDNTRLRTLIVGIRRMGDLQWIPVESDWWSRPAWGATR